MFLAWLIAHQVKGKHEHKHQNDKDEWDELKPNSSKPDKPEQKFIEVNFPYEVILKEIVEMC